MDFKINWPKVCIEVSINNRLVGYRLSKFLYGDDWLIINLVRANRYLKVISHASS
jgi:hypothetical protein